ncbi:EF-hand domain-containing protein [Rhodopseudomonas boonkerdii]|uniref:EF-hand domain-containing protein n=1 Tax=Rhodopseudomonas boonkerdii TaxID=475937 RepID=UPI001E53CDCB|nr:EF-hand domain-containing protein [Rhodopseudomonas boonkerdii]UGV26040.1 EF-hand domain-containing protein [Rhodopseudomonas boonkerdii]
MLGVAALATSAMDLLQSLTAKKSSSSSPAKTTTGLSQGTSFQLGTPAAITSTSGAVGTTPSTGNLSASTMSALLDAQSQTNVSANSKTRSDALKSLFKQLDGDSDGSISKAEFEDKLGAGGTNVANADAVFAKLDKDGNGSVSLDELGSALKGAGKGGGHRRAGGTVGVGDSSDVTGATTTTAINPDGSTTISTTYADGSKVTSTTAPPSAASTAATASYNAIEKMIQSQADRISAASSAARSSISMNA